MKKNIILIVLVFISISFQKEQAKILIVGDSISIGYTPFVQESLRDKAIVTHNPGNAQHTGKGGKNIEKWIDGQNWDIIQFNWGLWDLCYRHPDSKVQGKRDKINGEITFSLEEYKSNLEEIIKLIKQKSNAKLIFLTTSYVPLEEEGRYEEDALKYNKVARQVMEVNGVIINDIYKVSKKIHFKHGLGADNVHYTSKGYEELGKHISNFLKKEINK